MYRVLLPVDVDEERAAAQVDALLSLPADPGELSVAIVHVYEEIDSPADEAGPMFIEELNESLRELREVPPSIETVESRLTAAEIAHERQEKVGRPETAILEAAEDFDADAILLGMRKRSPVGKAIFGSVSQRVILDADVPVTIANTPAD